MLHEEVPPAEGAEEHGQAGEDPEVVMQERERRLSAIAGRQTARGTDENIPIGKSRVYIFFAIHLAALFSFPFARPA